MLILYENVASYISDISADILLVVELKSIYKVIIKNPNVNAAIRQWNHTNMFPCILQRGYCVFPYDGNPAKNNNNYLDTVMMIQK